MYFSVMFAFNCIKCGSSFTCQRSVTRHVKTVHSVMAPYVSDNCTSVECSKCGVTCRRKDILRRHILRKHSNQKFECHHCSAQLKNKDAIIRHLKAKHSGDQLRLSKLFALNTKQFNCGKCGRLFSCQKSVTRHTRTVHPIGKSSLFNNDYVHFECSECGVKCRRKDVLIRHIFRSHIEEKFECHHCGAKFSYKYTMIRHLKTKHSSDTSTCMPSRNNVTNKICALCRCPFTSRNAVLHHYKVYHHVPLVEEELKFGTHEEFVTWKKSIEDSTNSRFVVRNSYKQKKCTLTVFSCHRSGLRRVKSSDRKRRLKLKGSKRLDSECPAEMKVRQKFIDSSCVVSFLQIHLGHDLTNREELGHMFLRKDDRKQLATKIASGVPLERILNEHQNDDLLYGLNVNLNRKDLVSNKDLHSIKTTFNLKPNKSESRPFSDDVSCVETFVTRYADFILYYKKQHEIPDIKFPLLKNDDVVLIFMSTSQKELLMKHGSNVIAMDITHGMAGYDFLLQTLLILDYDGEEFPVAFAISNRNDIIFIDIFLTCIREKVGILHPKTLMTDMQESYYDSWKKIMRIPQFRLFCPWYVREAWSNDLKKISNRDKREIVKKMLYDLSSEVDEQAFINKLQELFNVGDIDEFLEYFQVEYITSVECWACCYWQATGLNTNIHLETFHRSIKYIHSRVKKVKELYSGLIIIRNILRWKLKKLFHKMSCGAITRKLRILRKEHNISAFKKDFQVEKIKEGEWMIQYCDAQDADHFLQEIYFVRQVIKNCPVDNDPDYAKCNLFCVECDACAHLYRCTCTENSVKNIMCKHIHSLLSILNKNTNIKEVENVTTAPNVEDTSPISVVEDVFPELQAEDTSSLLEVKDILPRIKTEDTSPILKVNSSNIINYKKKLSKKFVDILNRTNSINDLKVVESLLEPLEPTILRNNSFS